MERTKNTFRIALAALLMVVLLAVGGLTGMSIAKYGGAVALPGAAQTASQKVVSNTSAVLATTPTTSQNNSAAATTQQQQPAAQQQTGVSDARLAVRTTGPAVVTVVNTMQQSTTPRGRFGGGGLGVSPEALGSGVIINSDGYIITNQHVVANQQSLQVIFADGTQVPAKLIGEDAYTDIAVIKVDAKVPAVAQFGDSDKLEPGLPVVAIGTALGDYKNTVTEGIVSGLHRQLDDGTTSTRDLIQTDAAINHGNSGGPLLDLQGNVIGINAAVVRTSSGMGDVAEGLGFAIPSNTAMSVAQQLMKSGSISHPYVGISYQPITPELAQANSLPTQQGIYVSDVAAGSPAEKAGIQAGSIITRFDGVALSTNSDSTLATLLSKHKVGDSVKLTVIAPGTSTEKEVTVVLATRPSGQ